MASKLSITLWNTVLLENSMPFADVSINDYLCEDSYAKKILIGLLQHGIAFIKQVPINKQIIEAVVKRLFSIERTHFSQTSEIIVPFDDYSNSNDKSIIPHTEMCYLKSVPGLCIYHCLEDLPNYKTLFVDGFNVLNELKNSNADSYERLCKTNVTHRYGTPNEHNFRHTAPIITLDNLTQQPEQIR